MFVFDVCQKGISVTHKYSESEINKDKNLKGSTLFLDDSIKICVVEVKNQDSEKTGLALNGWKMGTSSQVLALAKNAESMSEEDIMGLFE